MTHDEALSVLLDVVADAPVAPEVRHAATEHVAVCSDCWESVGLLLEASGVAAPPEAGRMATLYGCEVVQEELFALAGLAAGEIRARHPGVARHLGWCAACVARLTELEDVEARTARGAYGPPIAAPTWEESGGTLRRLAGRLVVELREGALRLLSLPAGVAPVAVPAEAWRGDPRPATPQLVVDLPGTELALEIGLDARRADRVDVTLRIAGGGADPVAVEVRADRGDRAALVCAETVRAAPAVMRDIPPGEYLLDVERKRDRRRFRLALRIATRSGD